VGTDVTRRVLGPVGEPDSRVVPVKRGRLGLRTGVGLALGQRRVKWWDRIRCSQQPRCKWSHNFAIDGILRCLTESFVARTTNLAVHYVVAASVRA
jgi:hypothetical protein